MWREAKWISSDLRVCSGDNACRYLNVRRFYKMPAGGSARKQKSSESQYGRIMYLGCRRFFSLCHWPAARRRGRDMEANRRRNLRALTRSRRANRKVECNLLWRALLHNAASKSPPRKCVLLTSESFYYYFFYSKWAVPVTIVSLHLIGLKLPLGGMKLFCHRPIITENGGACMRRGWPRGGNIVIYALRLTKSFEELTLGHDKRGAARVSGVLSSQSKDEYCNQWDVERQASETFASDFCSRKDVQWIKSLLKTHFYRTAFRWSSVFMHNVGSPNLVCLLLIYF